MIIGKHVVDMLCFPAFANQPCSVKLFQTCRNRGDLFVFYFCKFGDTPFAICQQQQDTQTRRITGGPQHQCCSFNVCPWRQGDALTLRMCIGGAVRQISQWGHFYFFILWNDRMTQKISGLKPVRNGPHQRLETGNSIALGCPQRGPRSWPANPVNIQVTNTQVQRVGTVRVPEAFVSGLRRTCKEERYLQSNHA